VEFWRSLTYGEETQVESRRFLAPRVTAHPPFTAFGSGVDHDTQEAFEIGKGYQVKGKGSEQHIYSLRIALWALADWTEHTPNLCIQATRPRRRQRNVEVGCPVLWRAFEALSTAHEGEMPPLRPYLPTALIIVDGNENRRFRRPKNSDKRLDGRHRHSLSGKSEHSVTLDTVPQPRDPA
jgi:hypothetical protein